MRKTFMVLAVFWAGLISMAVAADAPARAPRAMFPETVFTFGTVVEGNKVTHAFVLRNEGDAALQILNMKSG